GSSEGGAQSLGHLGLYAMLAHGATANLYETQTYKSDYNPDFWYAFQSGLPIPRPKTPLTYQKFESYLRALGINVEKLGNVLQFVPLFDEDIKKLSNGKVDATKIIRMKKGEPVAEEGGLFDPRLTGGFFGTKYTHIPLNEVVPNPLFERTLCILFEINAATFKDLITGKLGVDSAGKITPDGKYKYGDAFKILLRRLDPKKELAKATQEIKTANDQRKAVLARKIKILRNIIKLKKKPEEIFLRKNVIVIPPFFRPLVQLKQGGISVHDINGLYRNIAMVNNQIPVAKKEFPEAEYGKVYARLYDAVKALEIDGLEVGINRKLKSVMDIIVGPSPKLGYFQSALLKRRQDLSSRGVIVPDPTLHLDEVGIPEDMAWKIFEPIIVRKLVEAGYSPARARLVVENREEAARRALEREMANRPVYLKRDPVLHKYGVMAFYPKIVRDKVIHIHPLVTAGFNADFDGDSVAKASVIYINDDQLHRVGMENFPHKDLIKRTEKITEYSVPSNIKILTFNPETLEVSWKTPYSYSIHKKVPCYEIETSRGIKAIVSGDHSLVSVNLDTFELERVRPKEAVGRFVPVLNKFKVVESKTTVRLKGRDIPLDYDMGFLVGAYCAEGCLSSKRKDEQYYHAVTISAINPQTRKKIEQITTKLGFHSYQQERDTNLYGRKYRQGNIHIYSTELARLLHEWCGNGSKNKHLPPFFLSSPYDFRRGLLAGLLMGDGSIYEAGILFYSTCERLIREVILLAQSLNIRTGKLHKCVHNHGIVCYRLAFNPSDLKKLQLQLYHPKKQKRLNAYPGRNNIYDTIPIPTKLRSKIWRRRGLVTRKTAAEIVDRLQYD
ncbi:MAG: hypothetical protein DRN12_08335, partial [Thermoplasmata archaeon]